MDQIKRRDAGIAYIADKEVMEQQKRARKLTQELNTVDRSDFEKIEKIVKELLGKSEGAFINPPFYCDYGFNIEVGKNFYANYNCTILDVGKVTIGDNCMFAPNVAIYTAGHPIHPDSRNSMYEYGIPVSIGDNCWLGGNTIVCPGVKIGNNVVIGAGSVVTKDIPDWSIAAGNPCRVIRTITEEDRKYYYKKNEFDEDAWKDLTERIGKKPRVLFMTPQGKPFSQKLAEEYAKEEDLIFLCGHYEGIDQRVLDLIVTDEVSAGDFVLTGGELPAMMMIDCISRLVPGVLNNEASAQDESFEGNLLEYPQYTRPEVFMGESVPPVLLSGHHGNIDKWRREQSILRTAKKRPDLLKNAELTQKEKNWLREQLIKKNKKAEKTLDN